MVSTFLRLQRQRRTSGMIYLLDLTDAFHTIIRQLVAPEMAHDDDDIADILGWYPLPEGLRGGQNTSFANLQRSATAASTHTFAPTRQRPIGPRI